MRRGSKLVGAVCPALAIAQMHGCETTAGQQVWVLQPALVGGEWEGVFGAVESSVWCMAQEG